MIKKTISILLILSVLSLSLSVDLPVVSKYLKDMSLAHAGAILEIYNTYMAPADDGLLDLGASGNEFDDLHLTGLAYIDGFGEDTDMGDFDIHSIDGLYGFDDLVYVDLGTDGYADIYADVAIRLGMSTADTDVRLEFLGTTNSGLLEWMEDEDYFRFGDDVTVNGALDVTSKINDNASYAQLKSSKKMRGMFTFSFDACEGERQLYDDYKDVFDAYGYKATLFYVSDCIGTAGDLTAAELTELHEDGFEIASHGEAHLTLTGLSADNLDRELRLSKWELENAITSNDYVCKTFAAPGFSASSDAVVNAISKYYIGARNGVNGAQANSRVPYMEDTQIYQVAILDASADWVGDYSETTLRTAFQTYVRDCIDNRKWGNIYISRNTPLTDAQLGYILEELQYTEREPISSGNLTADAGTNTTTVVDAALHALIDDYYNNWMLYNVTRSEERRVTDFDVGTTTITLESAITGQTTGDTYYLYDDGLWVCTFAEGIEYIKQMNGSFDGQNYTRNKKLNDSSMVRIYNSADEELFRWDMDTDVDMRFNLGFADVNSYIYLYTLDGYESSIQMFETLTETYGYQILYHGTDNQLKIWRHQSDATGVANTVWDRATGNVTHTGNFAFADGSYSIQHIETADHYTETFDNNATTGWYWDDSFGKRLIYKFEGTDRLMLDNTDVMIRGATPLKIYSSDNAEYLSITQGDNDVTFAGGGTNDDDFIFDPADEFQILGDTVITGILTTGDGGTTNYSSFAADGELNLYGNARVNRHLSVGAGQWTHGASAPTAGFDGVFSYQEFDNTTDDECYFTLIIPYRWDVSTDAEITVDWYYATAQDNGTCCWAIEYKAIKAGEAVTGAGTTIAKTSAGTHTTGQLVRTVFTTKILGANLENHDSLGFRLYRDVDGGGDAGDTLATNARLVNTHFHFTMNKLGAAL